jgi:small-conductance mechanosensitive channel
MSNIAPLASSLEKSIRELWRQPWVEMQLLLCGCALILAWLLSMLVQRRILHLLKGRAKFASLAQGVLPLMAAPFLVIFLLIVAHSAAGFYAPGPAYIIAGCLKIAMIWLFARALMLVTQRHAMAYLVSVVMLATALLSVTHLLEPTQAALSDIAFETSTFRLSLLGVMRGIFTLILLFWGASLVSDAAERWLRQLRISFNARELGVKFLRIALYALAFLLTLRQMGFDLTVLTVFGGALAVGAGLGLQRITSKTIKAGDLIEVGGVKGWVRRMAIRHTMIEVADGSEILIPNEELIISKVKNWTYTSPRARVEIPLILVYESDPELTERLLLAAARSYPQCLSEPPPICYLDHFAERGLQYLLTFWVSDIDDGGANAKSDVMARILRAFRLHQLRFAVAPLEK